MGVAGGFDQPCGLQELKGGASNIMPQTGPPPQRGLSVALRADLLISVGQTFSCRILGRLKGNSFFTFNVRLQIGGCCHCCSSPEHHSDRAARSSQQHNLHGHRLQPGSETHPRYSTAKFTFTNLHFQDLPSHLVGVPRAVGAVCHY